MEDVDLNDVGLDRVEIDDVTMQSTGYDGKVYNRLTAPTDMFVWRIKFPEDTPLALIPESNFYVTDKDNNLLEFDLQLDKRTNSVTLLPLEPYNRNRFYFLHIKRYQQESTIDSKKMPAIHVGFRLDRDEKLELIWMKGKFDPETVMQKSLNATEKRSSSFKQEFLSRAKFHVKPTLIKFAIVLTIIKSAVFEIFLHELPFFQMAQLALAVVIVVLVSLQYAIYLIGDQGKKKQSVDNYNRGVANYSVGYYQNAENYLNKALVLDPKNQLAETALEINRKYLTRDLALLDMKSMKFERRVFRYNEILIWISGFVAAAEALFADMIPSNSDQIEYLYIFFYTMVVMHVLFIMVQKKGYEKASADEYNRGADAFEDGDYDEATLLFRNALKKDPHNSHAIKAKDSLGVLVAMEERRKRFEADEFARQQRLAEAVAKRKEKED